MSTYAQACCTHMHTHTQTLHNMYPHRTFHARPIFSTDDISSDKHKMERYLHAGRPAIASVYAPICFPPMPLLAFKVTPGQPPELAMTGMCGCVFHTFPHIITHFTHFHTCSHIFTHYRTFRTFHTFSHISTITHTHFHNHPHTFPQSTTHTYPPHTTPKAPCVPATQIASSSRKSYSVDTQSRYTNTKQWSSTCFSTQMTFDGFGRWSCGQSMDEGGVLGYVVLVGRGWAVGVCVPCGLL